MRDPPKKKNGIQTRIPPSITPSGIYKPGFSQPCLQPEQQTPFFPNQLHQNCGAGVLSKVQNWSKKGVRRIRAWLCLHIAAASVVGPVEMLVAHGALPDLCWVSCSPLPSPVIALLLYGGLSWPSPSVQISPSLNTRLLLQMY